MTGPVLPVTASWSVKAGEEVVEAVPVMGAVWVIVPAVTVNV